ncbi:MAG: EamA family transporter [Clostridia bacterium]|nr:EamA family transporter [Clostridia bacterium]
MENNLTKKDFAKGRLYIIGTALLWGLAGVCVKSIPWNSISIMAARCGIGIIMLGLWRKSFSLHFNKYTLFGSVMMSCTGILYMMAIKLSTAATAIVLQYMAPIFVFLYAVIFQKRKAKLSETLIVLLVFGGCLLSFIDELDPTRLLGNTLGVLAGISFAAQIIGFSDKRADSSEAMYLSNIISFIVCLPFMFFDKNMGFSPEIIFWVLVLGIFQYGLANIFYAKGCQIINKIETSLLLTIEPVFNPIPVFLVTGEKPGILALIGFVIVIGGITLYGVLPVLEKKKQTQKNI